MTNRILKGLAVAAGTGLAMGFTSGRARVIYAPYRKSNAGSSGDVLKTETMMSGRAANPAMTPVWAAGQTAAAYDSNEIPDEVLDIGPLLDRLERLEVCVEQISAQRPAEAARTNAPAGDSSAYAAAIADLERRMEQNTREMEQLRRSIAEAEARMMESVGAVERRIEQTRAELPALIEPMVTARIEGLRTRFADEMEQSRRRTLEVFERAIGEKITARIDSIERVLAEQAGSIETLSVRAAETDHNLQRLVTAIEKLCERAQLVPAAAQPPQTRGPFEAELNDALGREPAVTVVKTEETEEVQVAAPAFTTGGARLQVEPKKVRSFFRSLAVAGFGFLAARFIR
jgi:hypothetical protein